MVRLVIALTLPPQYLMTQTEPLEIRKGKAPWRGGGGSPLGAPLQVDQLKLRRPPRLQEAAVPMPAPSPRRGHLQASPSAVSLHDGSEGGGGGGPAQGADRDGSLYILFAENFRTDL